MFERFKSRSSDANGTSGRGSTAVADRPVRDRTTDTAVADRPATRREPTRDHMHAARARQREEFGGINWGAAFFGFLSAAGLAAILIGIVSAAGATLAFGTDTSAGEAAETIGIAGAIAMLVVLVVSYFAGGYVAGRMSRFDGARQGLGVWLIALAVIIVLAAAGAVLGAEYNVLERLDLPRIPVDEGDLATGAIIALAAIVLGTLLAAMFGGKVGERYHRRVDRAGIVER